MSTAMRHQLTELPAHHMLRIVNGEDRVIAVFEGQVWVTQDNDPRDFILGAGESLSLDRPGLSVIEAFHDARVMLVDAAAPTGTAALSAYELHRDARTRRAEALGDA